MRLLIASDIHGSASCCEKLLEAAEREHADNILLLGDILYHGPRNDLPEEYAPKKVAAMLNPLKERILCVRGNCEAEVDQMMLEFPVLADYAVITDEKVKIYATHGHRYNEENPLPMPPGSVLLCGHTHIPACRKNDGFTYMNPGSSTIPKEESRKSYMIYEDGRFTWHDLVTGETYMEQEI